MDWKNRIHRNWNEVQARIAHAAQQSGRKADDIRLIAVTKYGDTDDGMIPTLFEFGCRDFGEARPQVLAEKSEFYHNLPANWHLIGHLQRNKVRRIIRSVGMIQSLDSLRLAETIHRVVNEENEQQEIDPIQPVPCLIEVAISSDETKQGILPDQLKEMLDQLAGFPNLLVQGLMGMAGLHSDESLTRKEFASLYQLLHSVPSNYAPNIQLTELSMGMSGDYEWAITEGATIVRVGSKLYE